MPSTSLRYRQQYLHLEDVSLHALAQQFGTPFYVYATAELRRTYQAMEDALSALPHLICFAVKANSHSAVIRAFAELGAGADVVSEGEIRRAIHAGVAPNKIVYSGVGKKPTEIRYALEQGILQFNVEAEREIEMISKTASELGLKANVALRVNPDVNAETHEKITTGRYEDKFGIHLSEVMPLVEKIHQLPNLTFSGYSMHIGSQLTSLEPFREAFVRLRQLTEDTRRQGFAVSRLDLGGGLGVIYNPTGSLPPTIESYGDLVYEIFADLDVHLVFEPGRSLVANAGVLVTQVILIKHSGGNTYAVVDAAMNDLMRVALYDAYHDILPVQRPRSKGERHHYDIVGPVCESSDLFGRERILPPLSEGDLLVIDTAGAYGSSMSSQYNSRPLVAEVMVADGEASLIRPRSSYEDLYALESIPEWLHAIA